MIIFNFFLHKCINAGVGCVDQICPFLDESINGFCPFFREIIIVWHSTTFPAILSLKDFVSRSFA
jgi:hypothetical protein